jgi:hypothetical protein
MRGQVIDAAAAAMVATAEIWSFRPVGDASVNAVASAEYVPNVLPDPNTISLLSHPESAGRIAISARADR